MAEEATEVVAAVGADSVEATAAREVDLVD